MKVSDILPNLALAKGQHLNIYISPGGELLKTVFYDQFCRDRAKAVGEKVCKGELKLIDAVSGAAFNITVEL